LITPAHTRILQNRVNPHKNRRILIIDDNRSIHADFHKILSQGEATHAALEVSEEALFGCAPTKERQIPFEVDSAYQGQEGVAMVKKALEEGRPYAMAFVDIRMPPGWDGVETTQKTCEIDSEIQIVICTAYSDYSWEEMFDRIGNDDRMVVLKKPFDTVEALQLAHALTEKWWLSQQSKQKIEDLEKIVAERTRELLQANENLQAEVEEHKQAEKMLRESEERFSGAFEYAPIGMALVSPEGRWIKVNRALCDMVGYSKAELLSRTFQDITHPDDFEADLQNVRRMLSGEIRLYQMEKRYMHALGHEVRVLLNVSLVRDGQDQPPYFVSQIQEITERKKVEARMALR
jgi:two-component system, cell cycle sensor histidine kinase and response regulator CckA